MNPDPGVKWFREKSAGFTGQLFFEEPLSKHTYYRIGGPARVLAIPRSREDLEWLAEGIRASCIPFFVMGGGSNLLVSDEGFSGLVIRASRVNLEIEWVKEKELLRTGAGVAVSTLLRKAAQEGWGGLEFLTGVPGLVGGVVFMNAGTHLGEAKDRLRRVETFQMASSSDGEIAPAYRSFDFGELRFEYRKNLFLPEGSVVFAAEWEVDLSDPASVKAKIDETLARRKSSQPIDFPSCGSVFKNPLSHGLRAWQVIEKLGLRGHRIGDAQFSEKHPNFIVNLGSAKASDVRGLIMLAKTRAEEEMGVALHEEVIYLGK